MLSSPEVPDTTYDTGYLVNLSTTTNRYLPSLVGPQWSAANSCHGSSGGGVGFKGSLLVTLVPAWHSRQPPTLLSTLASMSGNHNLVLMSLLATVMSG